MIPYILDQTNLWVFHMNLFHCFQRSVWFSINRRKHSETLEKMVYAILKDLCNPQKCLFYEQHHWNDTETDLIFRSSIRGPSESPSSLQFSPFTWGDFLTPTVTDVIGPPHVAYNSCAKYFLPSKSKYLLSVWDRDIQPCCVVTEF